MQRRHPPARAWRKVRADWEAWTRSERSPRRTRRWWDATTKTLRGDHNLPGALTFTALETPQEATVGLP